MASYRSRRRSLADRGRTCSGEPASKPRTALARGGIVLAGGLPASSNRHRRSAGNEICENSRRFGLTRAEFQDDASPALRSPLRSVLRRHPPAVRRAIAGSAAQASSSRTAPAVAGGRNARSRRAFQGYHCPRSDRAGPVWHSLDRGFDRSGSRAAEAFLAGLTPAQREKSLFAVDDVEWRKWMNQSFYVRQGVSFLEMNDQQRERHSGCCARHSAPRGLKQTRDIMRLNETLGELTGNNFDEYGEWLYHITIMGKPSATEPWGWQLDGHHVIINYFVLGDQVVMTPFFAGSEPVVAPVGEVQGHGNSPGGTEPGAGDDQCVDRRAAPEAILKSRKPATKSDRSLEGQCRPRLCRLPRRS